MPSVMQPWVQDLSYMQQSVLMCSLRGPDGLPKNHISKLLIRWLRRCTVISAFDRKILDRPFDVAERQGGSFTGASIWLAQDEIHLWPHKMNDLLKEYLNHVDEIPHHFQLHFMHAAEILGYRHPSDVIKIWWLGCYYELVNDMHLTPESEFDMRTRLGDNEGDWRARESVIAAGPND